VIGLESFGVEEPALETTPSIELQSLSLGSARLKAVKAAARKSEI